MSLNPADHSGRPRRRIARQQSEDMAALEHLLADARPEPSLPRDLVHTICTRATLQRELRQVWKARIAASVVVVLLLSGLVSQLPQRESAPSPSAPAAAQFGPRPASTRSGSHGSQWDWNAPGPAPAAAGAGTTGADAEFIDQVLSERRRAGDRLRSGAGRLP